MTTFSIALKAPAGVLGRHISSGEGEWTSMADVDDWIASKDLPSFPCSIAYNDEAPSSSTSSRMSCCGHTKGIVAWSKDALVWLIHSVPRWPSDPRDPEPIPEAQREYGQSFAFLTLPRSLLDTVLAQVALNQAGVYADASGGLWADRRLARAPKAGKKIRVASLGDGIAHVAKHRTWGKDLFEDALAEGLAGLCAGGPCRAETWMRPMTEPSPRVRNVVEIMGGGQAAPEEERRDHSKWAVSDSEDTPWVFVGDINRMPGQLRRGGGGIVITDRALWGAFSGIIAKCSPAKKVS